MGNLGELLEGAGDCTPGDWTEGDDCTGVSLALTFLSGGCAARDGLPGPRFVPTGGG